MKKLIAIILCLLLMIAFVGCKKVENHGSSYSMSSDIVSVESGTGSDISDTESDTDIESNTDTNVNTDTNSNTTSGNDTNNNSNTNNTSSGNTTTNPNTNTNNTLKSNWSGATVELLNDAQFFNGFKTSGLINTDGYNGKIQFFGTDTPQWNLAQWYSAASIKDAQKVTNGNTASFSNAYKTVSLTKNSANSSTLTLTCNGRAEYGGEKPTSNFYGWVHMGVEQYLRESPMLSELSSLKLTMTTQMLPIKNQTNVDPNTYSSQYNVCFIIKNTNPKSADYNEYIWVQVGLYDARYDLPPAYCGVDVGVAESSGQYIYTIAANRVLKESFQLGKEAKIDFDWLPVFKEALQTVQAKGAMKNTKWKDMEVLTFGFGYEIFRGEDYSISTKDLSLKATYADSSTYAKPKLGTSYTKSFSVPSDWTRAYGDWKISNNTATITTADQFNNRISLATQYYMGNYDIEFDMSIDERYSSKDCWAGISFAKKYMQDDHGQSGMIVIVEPDGDAHVSNFVDTRGSNGIASGFELKKSIPYKIEVRGNTATLYANGKEVCKATDEDIAEGGYISLISGMAKCTFKNFKVTVK